MKKKSCMRYLSRALSRIFCWGGGVDPRKIFGAMQRPETFLGLLRQLKSMEAHSGENYLINVMLCLSNFKVFVFIFMLCACNII